MQNTFENATRNFEVMGRAASSVPHWQSKARPHIELDGLSQCLSSKRACSIPITLCVTHHRGQQHCLGNFTSHQPGALPGDAGAESGKGLGAAHRQSRGGGH